MVGEKAEYDSEQPLINASHQRQTKGVAFWMSVCMRLRCIFELTY
jgi:hypothetical protein